MIVCPEILGILHMLTPIFVNTDEDINHRLDRILLNPYYMTGTLFTLMIITVYQAFIYQSYSIYYLYFPLLTTFTLSLLLNTCNSEFLNYPFFLTARRGQLFLIIFMIIIAGTLYWKTIVLISVGNQLKLRSLGTNSFHEILTTNF